MIKATFEFYEKNIVGKFNDEPSVYVATGNRKEDINTEDILWQAMEIERFDESEVLVVVEFEEDGVYLDRDEGLMTASIVRTDEPSGWVQWGDKKPTIFKIDRKRSKITLTPQ
jgi:hypothetical protein